MNATQLSLFDRQPRPDELITHQGKPAIAVDALHLIIYVANRRGERFFALGYTMEPGDGQWYYQILMLEVRGFRAHFQPAAARLYRHLKRAGILQPGDTFRRLAC